MDAKTVQGSSIAVTRMLLKDDKVIDTLETNSYGMGSFQLTPLLALPNLLNIHIISLFQDGYH